MIDIDITLEADGWEAEDALRKLAAAAVASTFARLQLADVTSELSLVFTDDAAIRRINAEWRGKDKATNVLSFPAFAIAAGQRPGVMLGDIIVARETVAREAAEENKPFNHHLTHLLVHGLLHLLGYDHETDGDAAIMEQLERDILDTLAIPDPYAVF